MRSARSGSCAALALLLVCSAVASARSKLLGAARRQVANDDPRLPGIAKLPMRNGVHKGFRPHQPRRSDGVRPLPLDRRPDHRGRAAGSGWQSAGTKRSTIQVTDKTHLFRAMGTR